MGYGEMGGGGSIAWRMDYKDADEDKNFKHPAKGHGGKNKAEGRATDGAVGSMLLVVINNGRVKEVNGARVVVEVPIAQFKTDQVQLFWGDDVAAAKGSLSIL